MTIEKGYFADKSVSDLRNAIHQRQISSVELVEKTLQSIDALNPSVNAFVYVDREGALEAAARLDAELKAGWSRGPLHGLPVAIKDNVDTAGLPTTYGSHFYSTHVPKVDAQFIKSLQAAGAVIIGKTLTSEFALGPTGEFSYQGACRNPVNLEHVSGGSSAGSAAAVASGMVPLAIGTDTAGSIRIPAAFCGIVGFKPSLGSVSTAGVFPVSVTLDHVGPMAKSVEDARLALQALMNVSADSSAKSSVKSIGWIDTSGLIEVESEIVLACKSKIAELFPEARVQPVSVNEINIKARGIFTRVFLAEAYEVHRERMISEKDSFSAEQYSRLAPGADIPAWDYVRAKKELDMLVKDALELFAHHQILALPTIAITAPRLGTREVSINGVEYSARDAINMLTSVWSILGFPAISIPAGTVLGLPCGLQVIGAPGSDFELLAALI